jgi:hypothetical protein
MPYTHINKNPNIVRPLSENKSIDRMTCSVRTASTATRRQVLPRSTSSVTQQKARYFHTSGTEKVETLFEPVSVPGKI